MEPLLNALRQTMPEKNCPSEAMAGIMREWKGMGENVLKTLVDYVSDIQSREQNLNAVRDSLEKRLKDLEAREKEFDSFREGKDRGLALRERHFSSMLESKEKELDEQLMLVHEHIESLEVAQSEVHGLRLVEHAKLKEVEKREREIERREKELYLFRDEQLREIALKQELLSSKMNEFAEEVGLENEKLSERAELVRSVFQRVGSAVRMLEGMQVTIDAQFMEIKSWQAVAHKSLIAIFNEVDSIRESMEKRLTECEQIEHEFNMLLEAKMQNLETREGELSTMRKKLLKEIKMGDEKLTVRLKEIESCEIKAINSLTASLNDGNLLGQALEERFKEFEEKEKEFNSIHEVKVQELESKKRQLRGLKTQLHKVLKWRNGNSTEVQNSGHQNLASLEDMLSKKLKEIESREETLNVASETLRLWENGAQLSTASANIRLQELENREKEFQLYQEGKMRELLLAEEKLRLFSNEFLQVVMLGEQKFDIQDKMELGLLERLDLAQNHVSEVKNLILERCKEIGFKEVELNHSKNLVERKFVELEVEAGGMKEHEKTIVLYKDVVVSEEKALKRMNSEDELERAITEPECIPRGMKVKRERIASLNEHEFKQPQSSDDAIGSCSRGLPGFSKHDAQMHRKALEMLLNDTEKDLELVNAEIFKILFLSLDPTKLVLDAVEGYYVPCLGRQDINSHVRRNCILLLDQLTKMSPSIQPWIRVAATRLACQWKSKMVVAENSLEVLGFLQFLAAYNLSCFDKKDLLNLLRMVSEHKQTPELFRILGLSENISDFIQILINKNCYLLASTYIHEGGLENVFPQAAVLNYYVQHLKAKHRKVAQDKAISNEIADLHVAIEHIMKHGLESEYSPDTITARIKQLEMDRASLKYKRSSLTNGRKLPIFKRFAQAHLCNESDQDPDPSHNSDKSSPYAKRLTNDDPKGVGKRRRLRRGWSGLGGCDPSEVS